MKAAIFLNQSVANNGGEMSSNTNSSILLGNSSTVFIIWASMITEAPNRILSKEWIEQEDDVLPFAEEATVWNSSTSLSAINYTENNNNSGVNVSSHFVYYAPVIWSGPKIGIFLASLLIMIVTVIGNLLVILSVLLEKKLQTPFNYYLVNLALTDLNVGLSVMTLFILYNLYGYFPFDFNICRYDFLRLRII